MLSDAEPAWRYLLLAGILGAAILLTVIADHIDHASQQYSSIAMLPPQSATDTT